MKLKNRILCKVATAFCLAAMIGQTKNAHAGWTGYLLGSGSGWAYVSVTPPATKDSTSTTKGIKGSSTNSPGAWLAAITPAQDPSNTNKYTTNSFLPKEAGSTNTIARAIGFPGVIWQAYTAGANGDTTDSLELQQRVKIKPSSCPSLDMNSALTTFDGVGGTITIKTKGTAGTALWIRGFEITAGMVVPEDDITTPNNETTDFLKAYADLRFENLMIGPFEYGFNGQCELVIHFTLEGGTIDNLAFVTDGTALSNPIVVTCPGPQSVACGQPYTYPAGSATGGCGVLSYSYSPAVEDLVVGLNTVTLTATDELGDTGTCTFTVNVYDNVPPVPDAESLPTISGQCSVTVTTRPTATDECSGTIIGTTTSPLTFDQVGTHTVIWTFDDGHGNIATQTQTVEVGGASFVGFYAPLSTSGGQCSAPAKTIKEGSVIPIKFDLKCGSTFVTSGTAPVIKVEKWVNCQPAGVLLSVNAEYQNNWHANWDTSGWAKGVYKIIVVLPDGSKPFVFVNLK